ncbi:MAG: MBG domain-containing protein [Clostridiales bacterium]|nr:MBG domain-containing protein [Clostridiales bacterium]
MSITRRTQRNGFLIGFAIIIALIASVVISLTVFTSASDLGAHAEVFTPHFASPTEAEVSADTDKTVTRVKFNQDDIANSAQVDGYYKSGDFYSSKAFSGGSVIGGGNGFSFGCAANDLPSTWYCDLKASENLKCAINDPFIDVTIRVYVVWAKPDVPDNSSETSNLSITYVSGNLNEEGESIYAGKTQSVEFNAATVGSTVSASLLGSLTVPDMDMGDADGFLRLAFADWGVGINFSIAWTEMYVEVTTEASSLSVPELSFDSVSVYDTTGYRNTDKANLVKSGDIVVIETAAKKNGIPLTLPKNKAVATTDGNGITAEDKKADGYFYARKYLAGSNRSNTFIKYDFDAEKHFERLYSYTFPETGNFKYKGTLDVSDDYSGQTVILKVKDSTDVTLPMNASTWRKDGRNTAIATSTSLMMDNTKPNQPELDTRDSVFYQKYVGVSGKSYYTDEASYVYENKETVPGSGVLNRVITGVNLGLGAVKPLFSSNATYVERGGSDIFIYAKTTRIAKIPVIGENSQGFDPTKEGSLYCRVYSGADGVAEYYSLILDLVTKGADGNDVFETSGFYSIEFVAVDEAGNYNYCANKQYMKVDVTDYKFTCQLILGLGAATSGVINMSDATPSFATIRDDGKIGNYVRYSATDGISFKRGAKVVVKLKMSSSGSTKYILTNFKTGGSVNIATTDNAYDANYSTIITDKPKEYAFEVNSTYSNDPKTREIQFVFKQRAYISVINTFQTYTGSGLKVMPIIKDGKGADAKTVAGTVRTTYSKTKDGEYTETLPVDKGIYYYKCELLNHSTYYATTENDGLNHTFEIQAATPQIEPTKVIAEEIKYGQSLAAIDFIEVQPGQIQDFNTHIRYVSAGRYYYDRSADGIIGYYTFVFTDKTAVGYVKPNAGTMETTVKFVPIKSKDGNPVRSGDGRFIRDENYKEVQFAVNVTVRRSTETTVTIDGLDKITDTITYDYDGYGKSLSYEILSALPGDEYGNLLNEYALVTYRKNVEGDEYTLIPPTDAGRYKVKIELRSNCNYTVGELEYDFVISKRKLNVICDNVEYDYKKAEAITPLASYGTGSSKIDYPALNYVFGFYTYIQGGTYSSSATEENFLGNAVPKNAGRYVVKTELSENNFENASEAYSLLTINKVGGTKVALNAPTLKAVYGDSHIRYLQPLKAVVLTASTSSGVRYSGESVKGSFIVSYRKFGSVGHEGETAEEFRTDSEKYAFTEIGRLGAYLCFIPSDGDELNFEVISREIEISVGKARPVCTDMTVDNIIYLTDINSVSDLNFNGKLKYLLYGTEYLSVDADDENYGYTMEFYVAGTKKYNAGEHNLDIKIIPDGKQSDKIEEIVWSFNVTVEKYNLILEADKNNYDEGRQAYVYKYGSVTVPSISNDRNVSVRSEIAYYDKDNNAVDGTLLPTGEYKAVYTVINDDYKGTMNFDIIVEKADLRCDTLPKIYDENIAVSYNRLMSDVSFNSGVMVAAINGVATAVKGRFSFDYPSDTRFTATGVSERYALRFIPEDGDNYNEHAYATTEDGKNNGFCLYLTVAKADISDGISVTLVKEYVYGELSIGFDVNSVVADYDTPVYVKVIDNGTEKEYVYSTVKEEGFFALAGSFSVSGIAATNKVAAGEYPVTFTVNDPNYSGSKTVSLTVNKKKAEIIVNEEDKTVRFNNMSQSLKYKLVSDGEVISETVSQSFYLDGNKLSGAPTAIGKYGAELNIRSTNYYADAVKTDFVIRVDETLINVTNTEQVYSVPRQVNAVIRLIDAAYTLTFAEKLSDDYYADMAANVKTYSELPTDAGEYWILLNFIAEDNNGYGETIVYKKPLIIERYTATISVNDSINVSYTGRSNSIRITTVPYGLAYKTEYKGENDEEYGDTEVLSANSDGKTHLIRITVLDANYCGEKTVLYRINPVALTEETAPVFNDYTYSDDAVPTVSTAGVMLFGSREVSGVYSVNIEDINGLSVGVHRVNYRFAATDSDGNADGNFIPYVGTTEINVVRKRISADDIIMGETSGTYAYYNGKNYTVDAYVRDGAIVNPSQNSDLIIKTYYNGQTSLPKEPGTYTVRAEISAKNYTGTKEWEKVFVIEKGTPVIRTAPTVDATKKFGIGDTFRPNDLEDGTGVAVIDGTNTVVRGTFLAEEKTFAKANVNDVTVVFTPYDTAHFNSVRFTIKVNVTGKNPFGNVDDYGDWSGNITSENGGTITLTAYYPGEASYGVKAGAFSVRVDGTASDVAYINGFGVFSIANIEAVPDVNGKILIKFTPIGSLADEYNIVYGYLPVSIAKADLPDAEIDFVAYVGKAFSDGKVIVKSAGKTTDISGTLKLYDGGNLVDMSAVAENKTYTYVFVSDNYNDITGEITINAKTEISSDNVVADYDGKNYDGKNITAADLGIKVINTEMVVTYEDIKVTVYKDGVETEDSSQTGVYTVKVVVDNGVGRGEKTFAFTVRSRDVSSLMTLDRYSATYGEVRTPKLLVNGAETTDYTILYKEAGASDAFLSKYLPDVAGSYTVKASVDGENYYGEKEFIFTISPRKLRIIADPVYSCDYGKAVPPKISFRESDSETIATVDYDVYYYSDTYSLGGKNVLPSAAGRYTARVVLADGNYTIGEAGYAEFTYVINKLNVVIRTVPTVLSHTDGDIVYNIKYGQAAGEIALSGGEAKHGDEIVKGIFRVKDGTFMPEAGDAVIGIEFIPSDDNYATANENVRVTIAPADASVTFTDLSGAYTGMAARDALTYTVSPSSVRVRIEFTNAYGQVVEPVNAGGYNVVVTSLDKNYRITSYKGAGGNTPVFVVAKASVRDVIDPVANEITVGDSLNKSSLVTADGKGYVYYYGFNNPVEGRFEFIEKSLTYKKAGVYKAGYVFTPADGENFASYTGLTEVKVNRATATIQVSNTEFTYSEGFKYPTFKTNPEGLKVTHDIDFVEYDPTAPDYIYKDSDIRNVGIYYFHAKIDDENYYSDEIEFSITINKKVIDLDFITSDNGTEETVLQYRTTYGKLLDAKIKLYPAGTAGKKGYLLKDYMTDGVKLGDLYDIKYESAESSGTYNAHVPPSDIGTYKVTVSLTDRNYSASGEILYKIDTGKIEAVYFDAATMENQVYGAVTAPIITTVPSGISYYIIYQGYGTTVPQDAGSYHISVYFNDNNFEKTQSSAMFKINKKQLSVTNIQVEDKIYDGIPNINVTGQLNGLIFGDEVTLKMSAVTANRETKVGSYGIEVVEYKLSGLQAANYNLEQPVYNGKVNIMSKKVDSAGVNSFITSSSGFNVGTTVEFSTVNSEKHKTTFLEKITGRDSKVMGYTVKVNGADSIIKNDFKVYLEIPAEFRDCDFEVEGVGKLEGQNVIFTREGDYITFNATSSGMVRFKKTEVKYGFVVIVAAVIIAVIGIVVLLIMNPLQNRRKVADDTAEKEAVKRIKQW